MSDNIYKFGVEELSDVIFVVGKAKFRCHKMILAARSSYFAAMFTSNFKEKDQLEIKIDADERAFRLLMQILYNGYFNGYQWLFGCTYKGWNVRWEDFHKQVLKEGGLLLDLADRFLVLETVLPETYMILCEQYCFNNGDCVHCAMKLLFALRYDMDDYAKINVSKKWAIRKALEFLEKDGIEVPMSTEALKLIMDTK